MKVAAHTIGKRRIEIKISKSCPFEKGAARPVMGLSTGAVTFL